MGITRRIFTTSAVAGAGLFTAGLGYGQYSAGKSQSHDGTPLAEDQRWQALLGTSLTQEYDYQAKIEGVVPKELQGTLYRNGPGLFERGGHRKANLLDGDGMIQAITFASTGVRFRNHFVRTPKFLAEQRANRYLMPTWATLAPRWRDNLPGYPKASQAGITVTAREGKLFAWDEAGLPFALQPDSLEDIGFVTLSEENNQPGSFKAHTKIDGRSGDWILLGWSTGTQTHIDVIVRDRHGKIKSQRRVPAPRGGYIHDFFATEHYVVVNLHAVSMNPLAMLAGFRSVVDSLKWQPEIGNQLLVIEKSGQAVPVVFDAPPAWMWHSFNAYEQSKEIIADFIGYDEPDHFIGENPALRAIMHAQQGKADSPGTIRRYRLNLANKTAAEEIISTGNHEFPMIAAELSCHDYRYGYACVGDYGSFFHDGLSRIDMHNGASETFRFGPGYQVGEPIFVARQQNANLGLPQEAGWLLSMVLDGTTGKSFVAVFQSQALRAGPVAQIQLEHHTPYSFHGTWMPAAGSNV